MREEKTVWTCDHCKKTEVNQQWEAMPDGWFVIDSKELRARDSKLTPHLNSRTVVACDRVCAQAKLREFKTEHDKGFWEHHNSLYPTVVNTPEGWQVEASGSVMTNDPPWEPEPEKVQP